MVAFIELPCNLHFAPLGLPARAAGSRRGPSKRVFRLGAMATQDSCANGAEGLGFAGRNGCAACSALGDSAWSRCSLAVRFTNAAKGVSRLRLLLVSLDRRRRSTFSTARVTA